MNSLNISINEQRNGTVTIDTSTSGDVGFFVLADNKYYCDALLKAFRERMPKPVPSRPNNETTRKEDKDADNELSKELASDEIPF